MSAFNNGSTTVAMAHQDRAQRERIAELEAEVRRLRVVLAEIVSCVPNDATTAAVMRLTARRGLAVSHSSQSAEKAQQGGTDV